MEHLEAIHNIMYDNRHHFSTKEYRMFSNIYNNCMIQYFDIGHISESFLHKLCLDFMIFIENIKDNIKDIEYINFMKELYELNKLFKSKLKLYNQNEQCYEDDDDEINIIDIDLLLTTINNNNSILEQFIKDNNLPNDFKNSSFNISEYAAFDYVSNHHYLCNIKQHNLFCDCNYVKCKNLQIYILQNPLFLFFIDNIDSDFDKIEQDIIKYNLFSFDGKINSSLNLTSSNKISEKSILEMSFIFTKLEYLSCSKIRALFFIFIFYNIYVKHYTLLYNTNFKNRVLPKLDELKNPGENSKDVNYWIYNLKLDPNIVSIMVDSFKSYFP